jgi:hypothetical protein
MEAVTPFGAEDRGEGNLRALELLVKEDRSVGDRPERGGAAHLAYRSGETGRTLDRCLERARQRAGQGGSLLADAVEHTAESIQLGDGSADLRR